MAPKILYLLWKDLVLRKNHFFETAFEVLLPIIIIILANLLIKKEGKNEVSAESVELSAFANGKCSQTTAIKGNVMYEPPTAFATEMMTKAACYAGLDQSNVKSGNLNKSSSSFTIGVKFHIPPNASDPPNILNYTLFPTQKIWNDMSKEPKLESSRDYVYINSDLLGLLQLQRGIDAAFLDKYGVTAQRVRLADTQSIGSIIYGIAVYFAMFFALSFMVTPVVGRVVMEKHSGAKEMMLMMGISRWELWVSKILDILLFNTLTVTGMVLFLYLPLKGDSSHLTHNPYVFWMITMYGVIGVMFFLFFMSSLFSTPIIATFITQVLWMFAFFFSNVIFSTFKVPYIVLMLMFLLPHIALMKGVIILLEFDKHGRTATLTQAVSNQDRSTLKIVIIMISVDIILYLLLTLYLDRVRPGKYGVPQPYNFIFKKSFWKPSGVEEVPVAPRGQRQSQESFEAVPRDLKPGVSVKNVSKIYNLPNKGTKAAVDNVTIDFYQGEISGLLGHNGAGKTTLFSMISGLSYPTSGKILIKGYDLANKITQARKSLGLCPQFDMLFDDLTAYQIIVFYGLIKGLSLPDANTEANALIDVLQLTRVAKTRARKLSGGQRRKVSLAVALIGGSEVLLLDEPSSGMDPEIRREIWELLLKLRGERTMILTTHFMEEADALCDRIAIMDHGKIRCYGSPMYLKSKYGKGYVLSIVVPNADKIKSTVDYVKQLTGGKFKSQNVRTLTFEIPEKEIKVFPTLFSGLEEKQKNQEISSYAVSFSALEDVFLRFSGLTEETEPVIDTLDKKTSPETNVVVPKRRRYCFCAFQLWALLIKKWITFRRSLVVFLMFCDGDGQKPSLELVRGRKTVQFHTFFQIFAILFLALMTILQEYQEKRENKREEEVGMTLSSFPSSLVLLSNNTEENKKKQFMKLVKSYSGDAKEVSDIPKGIEEYVKGDFLEYAKKIILGVDYLPEELNLYYNKRAIYMVPIPFNFIHNVLLKSANSDGEIQTKLNFKYVGEALDFERFEKGTTCRLSTQVDFTGFQALFYLVGPLAEKTTGAKELQLMLTSATLYWLSHLLFDLATFFIYIMAVHIGLGLSLNDKFLLNNSSDALGGYTLWGCGLILISYAITIDIKSTTAAFTLSVIIYTISVFLWYYLLLFRWIPQPLKYLHPNCIVKVGFDNYCLSKMKTFMLELFLYDLILFAYLILRDTHCLDQLCSCMCNAMCRVTYSYSGQKDDLVAAEEELVHKTISAKDRLRTALIADNLRRWFCKKCSPAPAVAGISFVVHKGECFGLLGVNGAGKTTTFKMLTGTLPPCSGDVYICSQRLTLNNKQMLLFSVGYCPQYGGLIHSFKGSEMLMLFGRLKGVPQGNLKTEVKKWLEKVNLQEYEGQKCGNYSGGNMRKLSTAIALIGNPLLVYLDEPTTGVDPAARRIIWNAIETIQKEGQSIVLTSHSMDECEALCSRLGIMVEGRFRCIGEITTIKNRFGHGFCIELKLSLDSNEKNLDSLKKAVLNTFESDCELVDEHLTVLQYFIKNKNLSWSDVFSRLQNLKKNYSQIESYSASSTTLEQVFIYFAKNK